MNAETLAALAEAEDITAHPEKYIKYDSVEKLLDEINKDEEI
ncbi:hypothetical protein [Phascolarctobacterium faecium]